MKKNKLRIVRYFSIDASILCAIIGLIFMSSSLMKAVNIYSFSQTINSFCGLLGLDSLYGHYVLLAILLCTIECLLPLLSLRMRYRSYIIWFYPMILGYFTRITYINYTSLYGGIESCGCFGEIIHLSPAASFYKSVGLLVLSLLLLLFHIKEIRDKRACIFPTIRLDWYVIMAIITSIVPSLFSYLFLDKLPHVLYVVLFLAITIIGISLCLKYIICVKAKK